MAEQITIPTAEELRGRLNGLDRLLTARRWERAAIVFAFTGVGGPRNSGREKPAPPKLNIRDFANEGYAGLTTPKAVSRYREAWITAIENGWAAPVEPGQTVRLPTQPFPAWPYGEGSTWEDHAAKENGRVRRPFERRVLDSLDVAARSLQQLSELAADSALLVEPEVRSEMVDRLRQLRDRADEALRALEGELVPS